MTKKLTGYFFLLALLFSNFAMARFQTPEDIGYKINFEDYKFKYESDGQYTYTYKQKILITSDKGVQEYKVRSYSYDSLTSRYDKIEISVTSDLGTFKVDPKHYQEKSLYGLNEGYDEYKSIVVPIANLKEGSVIEFDIQFTEFKPAYPGNLVTYVNLTQDYDCDDCRYEIAYPTGTHIEIFDDADILKSSLQTTTVGTVTTMKLARQNIKGRAFMNENDGVFSVKNKTLVYLSSLDTYAQAATLFSEGYERVVAQALPPKLLSLFGPKPAKPLSKTEASSRLATGIKNIFDHFTYVQDYRRVNGGLIPRDLQHIDDTFYGDCKDHSVVLYLFAKHLGLTPEIVLIYASNDIPRISTIPSHFSNHAIVRVEVPGAKNEYWYIDSTIRLPFVGATTQRLAGRKALVLGAKGGLVEIPDFDPEFNKTNYEELIDLSQAGLVTTTVTNKEEGFGAYRTQSELFSKSKRQIEDYFLDDFTSRANVVALSVETQSHAEFPYTFANQVKITERNRLMRSGTYKIIDINMRTGGMYRKLKEVFVNERTSDLFLDYPKSGRAVFVFKQGTYKKILGTPDACKVTSPWFEFERVVNNDAGLKVTDSYRIMARQISAGDIHKPQFQKLRSDMMNCLEGVRVVFE